MIVKVKNSDDNNICQECHSKYKRITPLINPESCLRNHRQYICSTCGRHICADIDGNGRFRALFPFKTLEIAKLYLRSAEVILEKACGIYEIENDKGRKFFKIFSSDEDMNAYLSKNRGKKCKTQKPLFKTEYYKNYEDNQLRKISAKETDIYMEEKTRESPEWSKI
ncbi:MAG TPA: hypothetical protein PK900_06915 [Spirochaetota bacterium]|nr:hypothetical protein [Spirochaetota bacterium]